jgi:hypothetical protein
MAIVGAVLAALSWITLLVSQLRAREPRAFLVPAIVVVVLALLDVGLLAAAA